MMNKECATSVIFKRNLSTLATFTDGTYTVYSINDNYLREKLKRCLRLLNPEVLVILEGCNEFDTEAIGEFPITKVSIKSKKAKKSALLNSREIQAITLLSRYLNHGQIIKKQESGMECYVGEYVNKKADDPIGLRIDEDVLKSIQLLDPNGIILKAAITSFGKEMLKSWIKSPLNNVEEIYKRHKLQNDILPYLPKVIKLLKKCRIRPVNDSIRFSRLREALKSAIILSKLLQNSIKLSNIKKYKTIYKILRIFEGDDIKQGVDNVLDKHRSIYDGMPNILSEMAITLTNKYGHPCSIVYLPELGFYMESDSFEGTVEFKISDKKYSKPVELIEFDKEMGGIYEKIKDRTIRLKTRLEIKIRKINFNYLYNFIGEIDGYVALINSTLGFTGDYPTFNYRFADAESESDSNVNENSNIGNESFTFPAHSNDIEFASKKLKSIANMDFSAFEKMERSNKNKNGMEVANKDNECSDKDQFKKYNDETIISAEIMGNYKEFQLKKNSIILNNFEIIRLILKNIIMAQIGMKLEGKMISLEIYDHICVKLESDFIGNANESKFLREVVSLRNMISEAENNSLCIIEDIGQPTSIIFGMALFKTVTEYLKNSSVLVATRHIFNSTPSGYSFYCVNELNQIVETPIKGYIDTNVDLTRFSNEFLEEISKAKNKLGNKESC